MPATTGLPLNELLAGCLGRIPLDVALGLMHEVARLLERAHGVGHVHGALSPYAVWTSCAGEVWLEWHPQKAPVHRSLPPEVRQGEHPAAAADIYALGAVAYELLTGLSISRAWAKAPLVHLQDVASPKQFNALVPPDVDDVVSRALARHPADRPERIEALARAAEGVVQPGKWEANLSAMLSDSFFAPAIRDLPVTCERARAAVPRPHPLPSGAASPPRLVVAEPITRVHLVREPANDDGEVPSSMPMVKIMIATVIAAAASLALCLGLSRMGEGDGGLGARVSKALVHAPPVVAVVEPAVVEAAVEAVAPAPAPAPAKIVKAKAKASHAKRAHATKSKRRAR